MRETTNQIPLTQVLLCLGIIFTIPAFTQASPSLREAGLGWGGIIPKAAGSRTCASADSGRAKNPAFSEYAYNIAFRGTLWQFMKFMNSFESFRRFVDVTTFHLNAGQADDGEDLDDIKSDINARFESVESA